MRGLVWPLLLLHLSGQDPAFPSGFRELQEFQLTKVGPVKIELPIPTLDAARPLLEDLRILDETAREIPWTAQWPRKEQPKAVRPAGFETALEKTATVLKIVTGQTQAIERLTFETPAEGFIKSVRLEGSLDQSGWTILKEAVPLFRTPGRASKLDVDFKPGVWPYLRLTLDDQKSSPLPVTGLLLLPAQPPPLPGEPWGVEVQERLEEPGRTNLRLRFPGRHAWLGELAIETPEPLFTRRCSLLARSYKDGRISERLLGEATLYRMAIEGNPPTSQLTLAPEVSLPDRELLLSIENGDSPPLEITGIRALRRPVSVVFPSPKAGRMFLLTRNPDCPAPRYDLAAMPGIGRDFPAESGLAFSPLRPNPSYRAPEALPGLGEIGAAIDLGLFAYRKAVQLGQGSLHQLELDLDVLSHEARDGEDLRLIREGHQIPYVLETTSLSRSWPLELVSQPDPKRPSVSRWSIALPRNRLPVRRLTFRAPEKAFQRRARLLEEVPDDRGIARQIERAETVWVRRPDQAPGVLDLPLGGTPEGLRLVLEVENGDNAPLGLGEARAWTPLTRLLFKAAPGPELHLYYGNQDVHTPEYDLALAAPQLLSSGRLEAALGKEEILAAGFHSGWQGSSGPGTWIFWGVLAVVVVVLLGVISKMLPASPPKQE